MEDEEASNDIVVTLKSAEKEEEAKEKEGAQEEEAEEKERGDGEEDMAYVGFAEKRTCTDNFVIRENKNHNSLT